LGDTACSFYSLLSAIFYLDFIGTTSSFCTTGDNVANTLIEASVDVTVDDINSLNWLFCFVDYKNTIAHGSDYPCPEIPAGSMLSTGIYPSDIRMKVFNVTKIKANIVTYLRFAPLLEVSMFSVFHSPDNSYSSPCIYQYEDIDKATAHFCNPMRVSVMIRPDSADCRVVVHIQEIMSSLFGGRFIFSTLLGISGNVVCVSPFIYINNHGSIFDSGRCMFSVDLLYFGDPIVFSVFSQNEQGGVGNIPTRWCILAAGKVLHVHGPNRIIGYSLGHSVLFFYVRPIAGEATVTLHRYISCKNPDIQDLSVLCQFVLNKKPGYIPSKSNRGSLCVFMHIIFRVIESCVVAVQNSKTKATIDTTKYVLTSCVSTIIKMICARAPADVSPFTAHTTLMAAKHKEFIKLHTKKGIVNSNFLFVTSNCQLQYDNLILLDHGYPFCFYVIDGKVQALVVRISLQIRQLSRVFTSEYPPSQQALELLKRVRCTDNGVSYDRFMNLTGGESRLRLGYEFTFLSSVDNLTVKKTCLSLSPPHPLYTRDFSPSKKRKHEILNKVSPSPIKKLNFDHVLDKVSTQDFNSTLKLAITESPLFSLATQWQSNRGRKKKDTPFLIRVSKRARDMIKRYLLSCFMYLPAYQAQHVLVIAYRLIHYLILIIKYSLKFFNRTDSVLCFDYTYIYIYQATLAFFII
jgi:hypothetical protein